MRRALIDTSAIYAFVVRADKEHKQASAFMKEWLSGKGIFVLADVVFAETMTLLKKRFGAEVALRVGRELRQNPAHPWVALGPEGERDTWGAFQQYDDKEWSYTDCALLALSRRLKISEVFSFEEHFDQMPGVLRVPQTRRR